jgi:SAM-dependent methyltransferase
MNPTQRFTDRAAAYVVGRPSYPPAAIDALFEGMGDPAALTVADLGAGTGISTRLLAQRGAQVLGIEPNAAMRAAAQTEPQANVTWIDTSAEETGLDEASVDLVTVFQAFHWFDHPRALREIVRILRPGGRAAVVYNERDEHDPLTREYSSIVRRFMTDDTEWRRSDGLAAFAAFEAWRDPRVIEVRNEHTLTHEGLIARTRSTSYLPQSGPQADELYAAVDELFARYERAGSATLVMRTIVARGDVGGDGG